jgi:hypothetical protein
MLLFSFCVHLNWEIMHSLSTIFSYFFLTFLPFLSLCHHMRAQTSHSVFNLKQFLLLSSPISLLYL